MAAAGAKRSPSCYRHQQRDYCIYTNIHDDDFSVPNTFCSSVVVVAVVARPCTQAGASSDATDAVAVAPYRGRRRAGSPLANTWQSSSSSSSSSRRHCTYTLERKGGGGAFGDRGDGRGARQASAREGRRGANFGCCFCKQHKGKGGEGASRGGGNRGTPSSSSSSSSVVVGDYWFGLPPKEVP